MRWTRKVQTRVPSTQQSEQIREVERLAAQIRRAADDLTRSVGMLRTEISEGNPNGG